MIRSLGDKKPKIHPSVFISEAAYDLTGAFQDPDVSEATALFSLLLALGTTVIAIALARFRRLPYLRAYDPAYAYEVAIIVREGIRRMHEENRDEFYYITVENENYVQPACPPGNDVQRGVLEGIYRLRRAPGTDAPAVKLLGSGAILNEVVQAQEILEREYGVAAEVWSVTSYTELRREALEVERWNLLHPLETARIPFISAQLFPQDDAFEGVVVAASDYLKPLPDSIAKWLPAPLVSLGTDGFGRSGTREELRDFFEVDARHVVLAALTTLSRRGLIASDIAQRAMLDLQIDAASPSPAHS